MLDWNVHTIYTKSHEYSDIPYYINPNTDQCGSTMNHLHLKLFSYIDMIWVSIA